MTTNFSQRNGLCLKTIQIRSMDKNLQTSLWNLIHEALTDKKLNYSSVEWRDGTRWFFIDCWKYFYKEVDLFSRHPIEFMDELKPCFSLLKWNEVYDFIEFISYKFGDDFKIKCNYILKKENSAYRLINNHITELINEAEIESIENACNSPHEIVNTHIKKSLEKISDKEKPDYENSVKESVSALEAWAKIIMDSPKATLGDLINNKSIHESLKKGIQGLYGFASDKSGVRHSGKKEDNTNHGILTYEDALFYLIICSAISNYLNHKNVVL